jgi:endonuclease/exonuclease/phosphatase family metal-dependent hydrolase
MKPALPPASTELSICTWNLGYGGLGAGSDFVVDGGSHWLPPSRRAVRENAAGIARWMAAHPTDILLVQELARAGPINYWVDLKATVDRTLKECGLAFYADVRAGAPIWPLSVEHGIGSYSRVGIGEADVWPLPADGDRPSAWVRKRYGALLIRLPTARPDRSWSIINIHLAAFDPGGLLRQRQIQALFDYAEREHQAGRFVVIGGDWNLRLAQTDFHHTTAPKDLTWLADIDRAMLPPGWTIVADPAVASVRTDDKPFARGENYTAVIDGFAISPNVAVRAVHGADLAFRHSDHQPVLAVFSQRPTDAAGDFTGQRREAAASLRS